MKKSLVLFNDQKEVFDSLSNEDAGKLIKAIFNYEATGEVVGLDQLLTIIFIPIRQAMDRSTEKYDAVCKRNAENVRKRWGNDDTKNTNGISRIPSDTKNTYSDSKSDSDSDSSSKNNKDKALPKKTIEEREKEFYLSVAEFKNDYSAEMLRKFYNYWSEHDGKKMKWEKEKTFQLSKRLVTWNDSALNKQNYNNQPTQTSIDLSHYTKPLANDRQ